MHMRMLFMSNLSENIKNFRLLTRREQEIPHLDRWRDELKAFLDEKARMIREMDDMIKQKEELENRIKSYSEKISRRK